MNTERQIDIDKLRRLPDDLEAVVSRFNDEQLDARPVPSEWSIRQNVHHMADAHMNAVQRVKRPLTEDRPLLAVYDQDAYADLPDYRLAIAPSLAILRGLHEQLVALLETLTEEQWARTGIHPEWGEVTVEWIVNHYAEHGQRHIDQINAVAAHFGE